MQVSLSKCVRSVIISIDFIFVVVVTGSVVFASPSSDRETLSLRLFAALAGRISSSRAMRVAALHIVHALSIDRC